jgi:hypothetical protein
MEKKFNLGAVYITRLAKYSVSNQDLDNGLRRHVSGDWGDVCRESQKLNNRALKDGNRIISSYRYGMGDRFLVITEVDRSATTILLPDEE